VTEGTFLLEASIPEEDFGLEYDATDTITVYENGKTWKCPSGCGLGTKKGVHKIRCYICRDYILVDEDFVSRSDETPADPIDSSEQSDEASGLEQWM